MRILHITDRVSRRGGADHYLHSIIERQRDQHAVFMAAGRSDEGTELSCSLQLIENLDSPRSAPVALEGLLSDCAPDIIHVHNLMNPMAFQQLPSSKTLVTIQDHRFFCPGQGKWTLQEQQCTGPMDESLCADCFTSNDYFSAIMETTRDRLAALENFRISVLSDYMKSELMAVGIKKEQIHVIPPFVHDLPAASVQDKDRILFVGRLTRAKGVHAAVAAWKKSGLALPLVFAGTGSERNSLESDGFEVTGWLNRDALADQYARAATIIMPSYWQEPYGIVGLEAASLGIPVVTWKSGGTLEWSEAENTVKWGDIDALAARLKAAVSERPTPQSLVNPSNVMAELLTLYQDVIHEHNEG